MMEDLASPHRAMNHLIQSKEDVRRISLVDFKILAIVSHSAKSVLTKNLMALACYFNSLMQILYTLPPFVQAILTADVKLEESKEPSKLEEGIDPQIIKRIRASKKLILET